ncbi:MAG: hypothetical protein EB051_01910 [Chlamydiia bacterium]|nr:hypothetical protein [Chlamydiia bacterium]
MPGEEPVLNYLSGRSASLDAGPLGSIRSELGDLRRYFQERDAFARDEARWTTTISSFRDAEVAARNFGCPHIAQCFAVGEQMVATAGAMQLASSASAGGPQIAAAVKAVALMISVFAGMDSDGSDALQALQHQMQIYFITLSTQLTTLQRTIESNHLKTLHQFAGVRREIGIIQGHLRALGEGTQVKIQEVRRDLAFGIEKLGSEIVSLREEMRYSLEELTIEPIRAIEDELVHWLIRGGRNVEWIRESAALMERWCIAPPCNKLLTGEVYIDTPDIKKYLAKATPAGLVPVFAKRLGIAGPYVNLDVIKGLFPRYVQLRKFLRENGVDYDRDGSLWREKIKAPVEGCRQLVRCIHTDRDRFLADGVRDMTTQHSAGMEAAKALLAERASEISSALVREMDAERTRMFHEMSSPLHPHTHSDTGPGGWFTMVWASAIHARIPQQREETLSYSIFDVPPFDLWDRDRTDLNLKGRFARLLPIRDEAYLYPTYLPLEVLPMTDAIKSALEAERLGLGRLEVQAKMVGRAGGWHGSWFYASNLTPATNPSYDRVHSPSDPFWIYMIWSFVDGDGRKIDLQQNRYSLNFFGLEHSSARIENNSYKGANVDDWCWNGDSISTSVFCRWMNARVDIGGSDLATEFSVAEGSVSYLAPYSTFHHFPPMGDYRANIAGLKTKVQDRIFALRKEALLDKTVGSALQRQRLNEAEEKYLRIKILGAAWRRFWFGDDAPIRSLIDDERLRGDSIAISAPNSHTVPYVFNPSYKRECEDLLSKIDLAYAEIMRVPLALPAAPAVPVPDPRVDLLAARVDDLTARLERRDEENRRLMAQIDALMRAMGVGGK